MNKCRALKQLGEERRLLSKKGFPKEESQRDEIEKNKNSDKKANEQWWLRYEPIPFMI